MRPPSDRFPSLLEGLVCEHCHGRPGKREHCPACQGRGVATLRGCPRREILDETWTGIRLALFAEKGAWPLGGGVLGQTCCFLDFCEIVWSERDLIQRELSR